MPIKTQKIIQFIPIINFFTLFAWIKMCYEKSVKPFAFVKEFLKICFWVLLTTVIRIAISFLFENELLDGIVTYVIVYIYDENGLPMGMQYHGASYAKNTWDVYWFEKNLFGDIIAVRNRTGAVLIQYAYNAYGECTVNYLNSGGQTTATLNPFRYRGYYFDKNLNLYYVNARYYDAKLCRWISPDTVEIIASTPMSLSDNNLYAYCDNNPVNEREMFVSEHIFAVASIARPIKAKRASRSNEREALF